MGRIGPAHGLQGAVVVDLLTDRPEQRFAPGAVVELADGTTLTVVRLEPTERSPIVTFAEITSRAEAEAVRGRNLQISPDQRRHLETDEFWPDELIGATVETAEGRVLGSVADLQTGFAQDRLIVRTAAGEVIIPFVATLVPVVDPVRRKVVVDLPEGFTD